MGTPNLHGSHPFVTAGSCLQVTNRLKAARSSLPRQPLWTAALARIRPAGTKMAGQKSLRQASGGPNRGFGEPDGSTIPGTGTPVIGILFRVLFSGNLC